jgi:hypothetical protein
MTDLLWEDSKTGNPFMKLGAFHVTVFRKPDGRYTYGLFYHHSGLKETEWCDDRFEDVETAKDSAKAVLIAADGMLNEELRNHRI